MPACALALGLAGWWWGSARLDALDRSLLAAEIGRSDTVVAVATGPVRTSLFTLRVPAEVRRFGERRLRERVLLELPLGRSPPQGAVLALRATVAAPRGPDDGFDERGWLARRGVHVVLRGRDWRIVGHRGGIAGVSDRLRLHVAKAIAPGLTGERRAVLAGIVLGEDEGLTDELRSDFKASGLYHLLAVSGQNITFLALGVLGLAWLLGIPRALGEVAAIAAIAGYVLAVGWQPSVVRAGVAGGLASLAWLLARTRDRWHFLALGAAVLLAWTPRACSSRASSSRSPPSARSSCCCRRCAVRSRATRSATGCATPSPSRPRAERRRRRSSGCSSAASPSTRSRRTCSSRWRSARCSGWRSSAR